MSSLLPCLIFLLAWGVEEMNHPFLPVWLQRACPRGGLWQGREGFPGPPGCPAPVFLHLLWAADCAQKPQIHSSGSKNIWPASPKPLMLSSLARLWLSVRYLPGCLRCFLFLGPSWMSSVCETWKVSHSCWNWKLRVFRPPVLYRMALSGSLVTEVKKKSIRGAGRRVWGTEGEAAHLRGSEKRYCN